MTQQPQQTNAAEPDRSNPFPEVPAGSHPEVRVGSQATAELIFTGDELLRGDLLNTNQAYLGEKLLDLGIFTTHALSVVDNLTAITAAIRAALARRPLVLILSGGLGPTADDLTREAVAAALGRPLEHHEYLLEQIRRRFAERGLTMADSNRKQASLPQGAQPIPIAGTAPGFYVRHGETMVVALPGVPWELEAMWTGTVEPLLRDLLGEKAGHVVRRIRAYGLGESLLAQMLSDLDWQNGSVKIGTRASVESLTVILRAPATAEGLAQLERIQAHICAVLGERVFGFEDDSLPAVTGRLLREAGLAVATAESCTGGLVAKRLTDVPGSSDYFRGGVVAYSNDVKTAVLGVDPSLLETKGAVSAEVAAVMAEAAARLLGSQCAVSTTGIAGPGGATKEKPVGLVYIGSVVDGVTQVERLQLFGQREQVRERAALTALDILRRRLLARTKQTVPPRHNP